MISQADVLYSNVVRVLRTGFRLAASLLVIGLAVALIRQEPLEHKTDALQDIPNALIHLHSSAFIDLAIITIAMTPVAAVIAIWLGFRQSGEYRFARYALMVLVILLGSITLSLFR